MAVNKKKVSCLKNIKNILKESLEKHKNDEIKQSNFGSLPPGIEGIAKLVTCTIDTFKTGNNKGLPYFMAEGIVIEPDKHNNLSIKGRRTRIIEALCPTPNNSRKTVDEHFAWVLNELRKLGLDVSTFDIDDIEETLELLANSNIYFQFRTWQGKPSKEYPNPRVNENWLGYVDYEQTVEDEVEDESEVVGAKYNKEEDSEQEPPDNDIEFQDIDSKKKKKKEDKEEEKEEDKEENDKEEEEEETLEEEQKDEIEEETHQVNSVYDYTDDKGKKGKWKLLEIKDGKGKISSLKNPSIIKFKIPLNELV